MLGHLSIFRVEPHDDAISVSVSVRDFVQGRFGADHRAIKAKNAFDLRCPGYVVSEIKEVASLQYQHEVLDRVATC